jgi:FecR protein
MMGESMKRHLGYQVCYVVAAIGAYGGAAHAAGIATVTDVVNDGFRTPPGHEELLARQADELVTNEALRTDDESAIHVRFVDGSQLSVEAESEVVLSDYVFDGAASKGLLNLNDGLFHFTSNGSKDQGVKLRTPVATIGVRGTEFLVHVDRDDATVIDILSGEVEAVPHGKGKSIICREGESILVAGPDEDALCGDLGSFSTAAGGGRDGPDRSPEPGHNGQDRDRSKGPQRDRSPDPDPDPDTGGGGGNGGNDGGGGSGDGGDGGDEGNEGGEGSGGSRSGMIFDDEEIDFG